MRQEPRFQGMLNPLAATINREISRLQNLVQTGRGKEAEVAARNLQRRHPTRADANEALALVLVHMEKDGEALDYAELAVKAEPRNAGYLINLGRLYLKFELIEEALPVIERAFKIDPSMYQAPWAMGEYFSAIGSGARAVGYLRQARAASPPHMRPDVEMILANSLSSLDKADEAEQLYEALTKIPRCRQYALAQLANLRKHRIDSSIFGLVKTELDKGAASVREGALLHLAIGRMHENARDYTTAYEHFRQAKAPLKRDFDLGEFRQRVDCLIEDYTPDVLKQFAGQGNSSPLPVFVVGMPRSGTTLTEQIIAAHPSGGGAGELGRIDRMQSGLSDRSRPAVLFENLRRTGPEPFRILADKYVKLLKFLAPGATRVVDKMPHNFTALGMIAMMFPNARIIHCARHPADNFVSAFQNMMNSKHSYAYGPEEYALYYKEYLRLMRHWYRILPGRIFTLRYEDLTADPEGRARAMLEFLGLPWDPRCLRFHETESMVKTFSKHQVRNPVNRGSVERWRNYEEQIKPLIEILGDEPELVGKG